jgi:hypothetical protein
MPIMWKAPDLLGTAKDTWDKLPLSIRQNLEDMSNAIPDLKLLGEIGVGASALTLSPKMMLKLEHGLGRIKDITVKRGLKWTPDAEKSALFQIAYPRLAQEASTAPLEAFAGKYSRPTDIVRSARQEASNVLHPQKAWEDLVASGEMDKPTASQTVWEAMQSETQKWASSIGPAVHNPNAAIYDVLRQRSAQPSNLSDLARSQVSQRTGNIARSLEELYRNFKAKQLNEFDEVFQRMLGISPE